MIWIACTAIAVFAGFFTLRPLFREPQSEMDVDLPAETELDRLLNQKNVIYRNLRDLEFEYKMGRLSAGDYEGLQAGYRNEAAAVLQRLERLDASENLDAAIETEIAARKSRLYGAGPKRAQALCPSCGAEVITGKKFCADCGHRL